MIDKEREYIQSLTDQEAVDCVIKEIDESYDKDYVAKLLSLMKNPK